MSNLEKNSPTTRERILMAACEVFAEKGFRNTTVRDICQKARVNVAAVNYHFGSKEKLYEAVCKYACGLSESNPDPTFALSKDAPAEDKLRDFIQAFLIMLIGQDPSGSMGMLMGREMVEPTHALSTVVEEMIRPRFEQLYSIVQSLLGNNADDTLIRRCCLSIVGQCLYYRFCRPVISLLNPQQQFDPASLKELAGHITRFSLNAMKLFACKTTEKE